MESITEAFLVNGIFDCGVPGGDSRGGGDAAKEWWSGGGDGDGGHLCRHSFTRQTILLLVPNTSIGGLFVVQKSSAVSGSSILNIPIRLSSPNG